MGSNVFYMTLFIFEVGTSRNSPEYFIVRRIAPASVVSEAKHADYHTHTHTHIVTVFSVLAAFQAASCNSVSAFRTGRS